MKRVLISMLVMLFASPAFAFDPNAEKTTKKWTVGAWEIGEVKVKETGEFSHCMMSTTFSAKNKESAERMKTSDLILLLKVNYDTSFNFILVGFDWNLNKGKKYNVASRYSTGKIYNIMTTADGPDKGIALDVNFGADGEWTQNFMEAEWVEFFIDKQSIGSFYLNGSRKAMTSMLNCYAANTPAASEAPTFGEGSE